MIGFLVVGFRSIVLFRFPRILFFVSSSVDRSDIFLGHFASAHGTVVVIHLQPLWNQKHGRKRNIIETRPTTTSTKEHNRTRRDGRKASVRGPLECPCRCNRQTTSSFVHRVDPRMMTKASTELVHVTDPHRRHSLRIAKQCWKDENVQNGVSASVMLSFLSSFIESRWNRKEAVHPSLR